MFIDQLSLLRESGNILGVREARTGQHQCNSGKRSLKDGAEGLGMDAQRGAHGLTTGHQLRYIDRRVGSMGRTWLQTLRMQLS